MSADRNDVLSPVGTAVRTCGEKARAGNFLMSRTTLFCAYLVTVLLACIHTEQSIVFHNSIPGDIGDGRLVNCILEHVYQCIRGNGELFPPAQFYPIKGTLADC